MKPGEQKAGANHNPQNNQDQFLQFLDDAGPSGQNVDLVITDVGEDMDDMLALIVLADRAPSTNRQLVIVLGANARVSADDSLELLQEHLNLTPAQLQCISFVRYDHYAQALCDATKQKEGRQYNEVTFISPETAGVDQRLSEEAVTERDKNGWSALNANSYYVQGTYQCEPKHPTDRDCTGESKLGAKNGVNIRGHEALLKRLRSDPKVWTEKVVFCDSQTALSCKLNLPAFKRIHQAQPKLAEQIVWNALFQLVSRCNPKMPYARGLVCAKAGGTGANFDNLCKVYLAIKGIDLKDYLKPVNAAELQKLIQSQPITLNKSIAYAERLNGFSALDDDVQQSLKHHIFLMNYGLTDLFGETFWKECDDSSSVYVDRPILSLKSSYVMKQAFEILMDVAKSNVEWLPSCYDVMAVVGCRTGHPANVAPSEAINELVGSVERANPRFFGSLMKTITDHPQLSAATFLACISVAGYIALPIISEAFSSAVETGLSLA